MPANLTPMYHKAEREYRRATTPREQLSCLENMLALIPKHKGTDKLQAEIKRKLKEARADVAALRSTPQQIRAPKVERQGCGQITVIGAPNSGKSQLVADLTKAKPEVANYPYTTHVFTPGMMSINDTVVQLVDTPPIAAGSLEPNLLNLIRSTDVVALCFDGSSDDAIQLTVDVLKELKERKTSLAAESAYLDGDLTTLGVCGRLVVTRSQAEDMDLRLEMLREVTGLEIPIIEFDHEVSSCFSAVKSELFDALGVIRIFTKRPGQPVDRSDPFILPKASAVEDVAAKVHQEVLNKLRFAKIWNSSEDGATVGRDHPVYDGDIVELHT